MRIATAMLIFALALPVGAAVQTGVIEGTVTDGGKPVPGAMVAAISGVSHLPTTVVRSDAPGHFRVASLPPAKYGVTVIADGHTGGFTLDVIVDPTHPAHADVSLGGDALLLAGTAVDAVSGQPIQTGRVRAARHSHEDGDMFVLDIVGGRYRALVPSATYTLTFTASGHSDETMLAGKNEPMTELAVRLQPVWPPGPAAVAQWP